jgi:hypothetical protein
MRTLLLMLVAVAALSAGAFFAPVSGVLAVVAALGVAVLCLLAIGTVMVIVGGPEAKPAKRFGEL